MGAPRARRWKLLLPPFHSAKRKPPLPPPPPPVAVAPSPALGKEEEEEAVPEEFLCPISGAPMADPVIMPPGRTYERACVDACADLSLCPPGASAAAGAAAIPNDALKAAIRTWCARSGRALPAPPSAEEAREAVLRAVPAARTTTLAAAAATMVPARSSSNLSCSSRASAASTSSSGSSSEMATVEVPRAKEVAELRVAEADEEKEKEVAVLRVAEAEEKEVTVLRVAEAEKEVTVLRVAEAEEEEVVMVVAKVVEKGDEDQVEAAMAVLLRETRESAERRRALCVPRLLAALRRVLHSKRHTPKAHADAAAALANLTNEPENRIPIVRAGAVLALVEVLSSSTTAASPEACEHAAGALFGLALHDENRAAIGVLGAVPPLLDLLTARDQAPRARRDAGMALYHLSLSAVNQSKLARAPAAAKNLLSIASDSTTTEPMPIRRLALMVICNLAKCTEGRAALMDTGAVAAVSAILSDDTHRSELEELCVAALYGMSRGNPRFRGLARAAGADRPLIIISERARAGAHKEMARKALRVVLGLGDDNEGDLPDCMNNVNDGGGIAGSSVPVHRRRAASWAAAPPAPTPPNAHQWRSVCID